MKISIDLQTNSFVSTRSRKFAKELLLKIWSHSYSTAYITFISRILQNGCAAGKNDFCSVFGSVYKINFKRLWCPSVHWNSCSDSELEVQRYGMKKNALTVDPFIREGELWMRQRETPSPNHRSRFLKTELRKLSFWILKSVRLCSVFRKPTSDIYIGFRTPLTLNPQLFPKPLCILALESW